MGTVRLPTLDGEDRERLEADISLEEIQGAIGSLQAGKKPGSDGLPAEFYSNFAETVAPKSMEEAIIVLIPKPGKDTQDCASYRPILL